MVKTEDTKVYFIREHEEDLGEESKAMLDAYEMCRQSNMKTCWMSRSECKAQDFNKASVVVFYRFEGELFNHLKGNSLITIVGPWCLIVCLTEAVMLPIMCWPIYNIAMNGIAVTCSGLTKEKKESIKSLVHLMAGSYSDALLDTTTHLITTSVMSEKYKAGIAINIKVMQPQWVDAVWADSQSCNVKATSDKYDIYKVKVFENLIMSLTGFTDKNEKGDLVKMIEDNGGHHTPGLTLSKTDVLICQKGTTSEKYKAAMKSGKVKCVNRHWIYESVSKGYALPTSDFPVQRSTSTPNKEMQLVNFSTMSAIMASTTRELENTYNDTVNVTNIPELNASSKNRKRKSDEGEESGDTLTDFDVKRAKLAGTFLDGCNICLLGFGGEEKGKLSKILDFSGATRYEDINDRLTHCIVGDVNCQEVKSILRKDLLKCPVVNINWLTKSIRQKQAVSETDYLIKTVDPTTTTNAQSSPLSQKGLTLLKNDSQFVPKKRLNFDNFNEVSDNSILNEYLSVNCNKSNLPSTSRGDDINKSRPSNGKSLASTMAEYAEDTDDISVKLSIFDGLVFRIHNYEPDEAYVIETKIQQMSGQVRTKRIKANYIVLPEFLKEPYNTSVTTVNSLWINHCHESETLVDLEYYHKPLLVKQTKPLDGCVVTISTYVDYERTFLERLLVELGAILQNELSRKILPELDILVSTHLVAPNTDSRKYQFAARWQLPIITKDWLLECARVGKMVDMDPYFVEEKSSDIGKEASSAPSEKESIENAVTPQRHEPQSPHDAQEETPSTSTAQKISSTPRCVNKIVDKSISTPVQKLIEEFKENDLKTPETVVTPKPVGYLSTPETPLGAFLDPNPSPHLRKAMKAMLNKFPEIKAPPSRRLSTPLSEVKRKCWDRLLANKPKTLNFDSDNENKAPQSDCASKISDVQVEREPINRDIRPTDKLEQLNTQDLLFEQKLVQLENKLSTSSAKKKTLVKSRVSAAIATADAAQATAAPVPNDDHHMLKSQALTVGWDFANSDDIANRPLPPKLNVRTFMLSGISNEEQKRTLVKQIESLGGKMTTSMTYDPNATHLVCLQAARNEKTFCCMAAGKWILHAKYIEDSAKNKGFVDEELYEFGNPKFIIPTNNADAMLLARHRAIHYWRKEISSRGYGAFHDIRAIVVAGNRNSIESVIKAGGGTVLDMTPPFYESVAATHCFVETKLIKNINEYVPLAKQGIYCLNILYISEFLHLTKKSVKDSVLSSLQKYYSDV